MIRKIEDLLYAPIGLIAGASQVIPELAEQGRIQVANARVAGQLATRLGADKISDHLSGVLDQANTLLVSAGLMPPRTSAGELDAPSADAPRVEDAERPVRTVPADEPTREKVPAAEELAIVDYDSLAASQVVPRLVALEPSQLEDVRRYELAHRGRKTILGRVAQLQS